MAHVTSTIKRKSFSTYNVQRLLGVQERGGERGNQYQSGNPTNVGMAPSAKDHAEALGIADRTVERWEKDRKEIASDPELAATSVTPDGYQEAKAEVRKRRNIVVLDYRIDDAMGAIKGISELVERQRVGSCLKPPSNVRGT